MSRVKFTTTIDTDLLAKAKEHAVSEGFSGTNELIERALGLYFANCEVQVWEKPLKGGWFKKLAVRPGKVVFESIRTRRTWKRFNSKQYTPEVLEQKGWERVWKLKRPKEG